MEEKINNEAKIMVDWIWKLQNKMFVEGVVQKEWRRTVTIPLFKVKVISGKKETVGELVYLVL